MGDVVSLAEHRRAKYAQERRYLFGFGTVAHRLARAEIVSNGGQVVTGWAACGRYGALHDAHPAHRECQRCWA